MSLRLSLCLSVALASAAAAQQLPGYTSTGAQRERALEADAIARTTPASAEAWSRALSKETHVSGTPAQARTRDYVVSLMKQWGLDTDVRTYDVWMPIPTSVHLWRVDRGAKELPLAEPPVKGDPASALPQYPTVNGYSGVGDVTGDVVYVNYGLIEDYAELDSMGVSVKGKIVVARYGRSFRGIKAREAEKHGAIALLIYSDPQDDGYVRGDVYPDGPMRPPGGVQRGSVMNVDGDPSTPGYPSTPGAKRIPADQMDVPHIPVVPIGYGNASELLRDLRGAEIPQAWQGGLPFRYHVGPGPVRARLAVQDDRARNGFKKIFDTFGIVRGTEFPDEFVIIGGHRDAWTPGTADNVSGTVSVLEAARAVAEQLKEGKRPRRTIVFATWDAEEWGLIGSTEYVEDDSLRLLKGGAAYFNQDVAAQGVRFGGGGAPSLRPTLRDVAREVPDPNGKGSVYDQWRLATRTPAGAEPAMGDPGGGSDFAGFYNHLGVPIAEWSFGGPGGVYHSQYDDFNWMSKFGDPGFKYHAAAGSIGAAMVLRIANADILPYDYVELAQTMKTYLPAMDKEMQARHWNTSTAQVAQAIDRLEAAATAFNATRDSVLAASPAHDVLVQTNAALMRVERSFTRPNGLQGREWFRNLLYVADRDNGYANMVFPSVNEAIRDKDEARTARELADLSAHIDAATAALGDARRAATGR
ncbi:MAG TPA: M20/M25/M40 family metallo-hydrolase [Gemmatimonadaceae bacterium]|nr:M20/M25/M40 family metallo-hydrolase [Gemmatimonadaceae bacterium]